MCDIKKKKKIKFLTKKNIKIHIYEFKIESKPGAGGCGASVVLPGGVVDPPAAAPPAAPGLNIDVTKFDILNLIILIRYFYFTKT